jgi:hypothetical protein
MVLETRKLGQEARLESPSFVELSCNSILLTFDILSSNQVKFVFTFLIFNFSVKFRFTVMLFLSIFYLLKRYIFISNELQLLHNNK